MKTFIEARITMFMVFTILFGFLPRIASAQPVIPQFSITQGKASQQVDRDQGETPRILSDQDRLEALEEWVKFNHVMSPRFAIHWGSENRINVVAGRRGGYITQDRFNRISRGAGFALHDNRFYWSTQPTEWSHHGSDFAILDFGEPRIVVNLRHESDGELFAMGYQGSDDPDLIRDLTELGYSLVFIDGDQEAIRNAQIVGPDESIRAMKRHHALEVFEEDPEALFHFHELEKLFDAFLRVNDREGIDRLLGVLASNEEILNSDLYTRLSRKYLENKYEPGSTRRSAGLSIFIGGEYYQLKNYILGEMFIDRPHWDHSINGRSIDGAESSNFAPPHEAYGRNEFESFKSAYLRMNLLSQQRAPRLEDFAMMQAVAYGYDGADYPAYNNNTRNTPRVDRVSPRGILRNFGRIGFPPGSGGSESGENNYQGRQIVADDFANNSYLEIKGNKIFFPRGDEVEPYMSELYRQLNIEIEDIQRLDPNAQETIDRVYLLAAWYYKGLVSIHPTWNGVGRTAKIMRDWLLRYLGFPPPLSTPDNDLIMTVEELAQDMQDNILTPELIADEDRQAAQFYKQITPSAPMGNVGSSLMSALSHLGVGVGTGGLVDDNSIFLNKLNQLHTDVQNKIAQQLQQIRDVGNLPMDYNRCESHF